MDRDVAKRLPTAGKSAPTSYSPYWEEELKAIDARVRALIRLSSFANTVTEHHGRVLARDSGSDSKAFREAKLLSVLVTRSLESSMALARSVCALRRENACVALRSYGSEFNEGMRGTVLESQDSLFGASFCKHLATFSERGDQEDALLQAEAALKAKANKKSKSNSGKRNNKRSKRRAKKSNPQAPATVSAPSTATTPKPSPARPRTKGKRTNSGPKTSGPPPNKRFRGGKQSRS
jgi:hypothetical protein